jgi:hypothetical protein
LQAKGATPTSIDAPNDGRAAPDATYLRSRELGPPASPAQRFHIAKAQGTLTGVEAQSAKYAAGLPDNLPAQRRPLPFLFESNGSVSFFTNGLDPVPRSRQVFNFPRPETVAE